MFKFYSQNQIQLLPPTLEEQIEKDHLSRLINSAVDELNTSLIEEEYSEIGQNGYNPKMLLKNLIYGYSIGVRSSRKIARSCKENIIFMWLSGRQEPNFRTISDFRKDKLINFKDIFKQVLEMCKKLGMARCGKVCLDGTKMQASANRHKAIYRKMLDRQNDLIDQQIDEIIKEAEMIDKEEEALYGMKDIMNTGKEIDKKTIKELAKELNRKKEKNKKKREKAKDKKKRTEEKIEIMGEKHNSYTTVDKDATVMMMKEGYCAPGYNVQLATEHQVILGYGVYPKCTDYHLLRQMREEIKENMGKYPELMIEDAGYGTKENSKYCKRERQKFLMPYRDYAQDRTKRKKGIYEPPKKEDRYWEDMKWKMWKELESEKGKKLMRRRGYDVEPTIGDIKSNMGMRRFLLRGRKKVQTEMGLISLAHNIKKIKTTMKYWENYMRRMLTIGILAPEII